MAMLPAATSARPATSTKPLEATAPERRQAAFANRSVVEGRRWGRPVTDVRRSVQLLRLGAGLLVRRRHRVPVLPQMRGQNLGLTVLDGR